MCGEEPAGLNSLPAGRGDEKADSRKRRSRSGASSSARPPLVSLGSQRLPTGLDGSALFICWEGKGHSSPPPVPTPCCKPASPALLLVTEVLLPPAEGNATAPALSAAARRGFVPQLPQTLSPPPHAGSGEVALRAIRAGSHCLERTLFVCLLWPSWWLQELTLGWFSTIYGVYYGLGLPPASARGMLTPSPRGPRMGLH